LHRVAIMRGLRKIGAVKRAAGFSQLVELPPSAALSRVVVSVQDSDMGRVHGAAISESGANR
jgi:hypothetical protein